jgi:hypothetical protein
MCCPRYLSIIQKKGIRSGHFEDFRFSLSDLRNLLTPSEVKVSRPKVSLPKAWVKFHRRGISECRFEI